MSNIIPGRLYNVQNAADPLALLQHNMEVLAEDLYTLKPTPVGGTPNSLIGPPTTGDHVQGELWRDSLLALWRCESAGVPGDWRQVAPATVAQLPELEEPPQFPENYQVATPEGLFVLQAGRWQPVYLQPFLYINTTPAEIAVETEGHETSATLASFVIPASRLFPGNTIRICVKIQSETLEGHNQLHIGLGSLDPILILDQTSFLRTWTFQLDIFILSLLGANMVGLLSYNTSGDTDSSFYFDDLWSLLQFSSAIASGLPIEFDGRVTPPGEGTATLRLDAVFAHVAP